LISAGGDADSFRSIVGFLVQHFRQYVCYCCATALARHLGTTLVEFSTDGRIGMTWLYV
jgi:hypothetical protein